MTRSVMWFRRDLRLADNPALVTALANHADVVPLFVLDPALLEHLRCTPAGVLDECSTESG